MKLLFFLPVDGVKLSVDSLKIGKIVLKSMSEEQIKRFSDLPRNLAFEDWIRNPWAQFTTFAEDKKAMEQALDEIEFVFDLIRFSTLFIYHKGFKISIGLQGDVPKLGRRIYVTKPDLSKIFVNEYYPSGGSPFDISDKNIAIMKNIGIFKIMDILEKLEKKRTDFERTILLGVHWFADSQTQKELENEFLSLMICLEIFLTPNDKRDPISTSISEAAAIILKTEEERISLKEEIQSYYDKRSDIVHGRKSILTEADVDKLREHLKHLIPFMVNHKDDFKTKHDLMKRISEYKISGGIFKP